MKKDERSKEHLIEELIDLRTKYSDLEEILKSKEEKNKEFKEFFQDNSVHLNAVNQELQTFFYSISHDFRAPLRTISCFSQILLEDYSQKLDDEGKDFLLRICKGCKGIEKLIDGLLILSRINRVELKIDNVNLSLLAQDKAEELKRIDPERNVDFIIAPDILFKGDKDLIKVALEHLIDNGWKFSSKKKKATIELGLTEIERNKAVYFVKDNGVGFNLKYARRLFGPFQRFHEPDDYPGQGIGLATVQRIIHRHYGQIWVETEEDKGSTFYFTSGKETRILKDLN